MLHNMFVRMYCAMGGISAAKKVAAIAEASDVLLIPHNPLDPVSTAACLQICAFIPNLGIQELPTFCLNGAEYAKVKQPFRFKNGFMLIPEAPGIGVELSDKAYELYPAKSRGSNEAFRYYDGSVKDWKDTQNGFFEYSVYKLHQRCIFQNVSLVELLL